LKGAPPVTELEFQELGAWFEQNDERLSNLCKPSGLLDCGNGRTTSTSSIRYGIQRGPRDLEAGELAVELRQLRARYGDA
jgi:hypothetical protein